MEKADEETTSISLFETPAKDAQLIENSPKILTPAFSSVQMSTEASTAGRQSMAAKNIGEPTF